MLAATSRPYSCRKRVLGVIGQMGRTEAQDGEPKGVGDLARFVCGVMKSDCRDAGHRYPLVRNLKRALASTALIAAISAAVWFGTSSSIVAGGETRTLSLYQVHTKESLTVTYMVNGRYVPSALKKINYLMRDWRRNEVTRMDPKTIDLMWELHADLGSERPIHIICGYRSAGTNALLKKIGRNVARKSQHILGKAIDLYFPDVPSEKIRNSALVRKVGGVGYYRSSGGPTGFVHIDSGNVRHWGPGISKTQMARIMKDYRRTVGARLNRKDQTVVASADEAPAESAAPQIEETAYEEGDDLAQLSEEASKTPARPKAKPALEKPADIVEGYPVPKPRSKPVEIQFMAAAAMKIEPASAPPPSDLVTRQPALVREGIGTVEAAETMIEEGPYEQASNLSEKGSLATTLRDGTAEGVPTIQALAAASVADDPIARVLFDPDSMIRRDGAPKVETDPASFPIPGIPMSSAVAGTREDAGVVSGNGKDDRLTVNRDDKGSLPGLEPAPEKSFWQKLGFLGGN